MKVFHCDKYEYIGIYNCCNVLYHAFRCTKIDFKAEIVLVREARVTYPDGKAIYYDENQLIPVETFIKPSQVGLVK